MWLAGAGRVSRVEEFEVANVESLRLGRDADKIACVVDPAGYFWEVLERHERNVSEALCKVFDIIATHPYSKAVAFSAWHIDMCWVPCLSKTCYIAVVALPHRLSPHAVQVVLRLYGNELQCKYQYRLFRARVELQVVLYSPSRLHALNGVWMIQVMLRVSGDLDTHIKFYHEVQHLTLLRTLLACLYVHLQDPIPEPCELHAVHSLHINMYYRSHLHIHTQY